MPLPDESTIYVRVWTGQKCIACGTEFQYLRRFTVQRRDTVYNATVESVEAEYKRHASMTAEPCPCPHCGWLQPDMVAGVKAVRHGAATFAGALILLAAVIAAGLGLLPREIGCAVCAGIAATFLPIHLFFASWNPNRSREQNLQLAQRRLDDGSLKLARPGGAFSPPPIPGQANALALAGASLVGSACAFMAPLTYSATLLFGQVPGVILFIFSGSRFANIALEVKKYASSHKILDVNSTLVLDESVPEDFQRK